MINSNFYKKIVKEIKKLELLSSLSYYEQGRLETLRYVRDSLKRDTQLKEAWYLYELEHPETDKQKSKLSKNNNTPSFSWNETIQKLNGIRGDE